MEHDSEIIADNLKIKGDQETSPIDRVNTIMKYIISLGLFEEKNNVVSCLTMGKRLDQSMTNNKRMRSMISDIKENNTGFIYIIKSIYGYKIGKTKNYANRLALFDVKLPFKFDIIRLYKSDNYHNDETNIHKLYICKLLNGEWYSIDDIDINAIDSYIIKNKGTIEERHDKSCKNRIDKNRIDNTSSKSEIHEEADRLAILLYTLHKDIDSGYQVSDQRLHSWACDIDKINRINGREWKVIEKVLRWAKTNNFWSTNIMSGKKFRDNFDQLLAKMPKQVYTEYKPSLSVVESTPEFDAMMERNVP